MRTKGMTLPGNGSMIPVRQNDGISLAISEPEDQIDAK